jgi:beta-N-acetylhexosaminidase
MTGSANVLRRFLVGFEGTRLPAATGRLLREGLAGVALYRRNWETVAGLSALTDEIRQAAGTASVLIGIDQEGGTKFSLPEPFTPWPSPEQLGRRGDAGAVEHLGRAMARELRAVGVNLNFAPMVDVHVNPASPVTAVRSYGSDPARVGELGAALVRGLGQEEVLACGKHFPGHGDVAADPHDELPVSDTTEELLQARDLAPFSALVAAGVPSIMTAHILLPQVDAKYPATLSRAAMHDTLRLKLGFRGVVFADDLGMGAIRQRYGAGHAAIAAFQAGVDIAMLCHDASLVPPALEAVQRVYESHNFDELEWRAAHLRIDKMLRRCSDRLADPAGLEVIGHTEHRALAKELA